MYNLYDHLGLNKVDNANEDTDAFLVLKSSGQVCKRTGAELLDDIGGWPGSAHGVTVNYIPYADSTTTWDDSPLSLSSGNVGINETAADTALYVRKEDAVVDAVTYPLTVAHTTTGEAASGIGVGFKFCAEDLYGTINTLATIEVIDTTPTSGNSSGTLIIRTYDEAGDGLSSRVEVNEDLVTLNVGLSLLQSDASVTPIASITQSSTGDASFLLELNGGQSYTIGIDNSDGDVLKISPESSLSNTDYLSMNSSGFIGLGIAPSSDDLFLAYYAPTNISNANLFSCQYYPTCTSTGSQVYYGFNFNCKQTVNAGVTNSGFYAGTNTVSYKNGAGTLSWLLGNQIDYGMYTDGAGIVTNAIGAYYRLHCNGGTITNAYGLYFYPSGLVGGTVTNEWCIYSLQDAPSRLINDLQIDDYSYGIVLGDAQEAKIYEDGTNLIFNSRNNGTDNFLFTGGGSVTINAGALDIIYGTATGISLLIGTDESAHTRTDNIDKYGTIALYHRTAGEEPMGIIEAVSEGTCRLFYGGGAANNLNAVMAHYFRTGANNITLNGTDQLIITHGYVNVVGTCKLSTCANAGTDTDQFLVRDASGYVDYRTGAEVLSDIGAAPAFSLTTNFIPKAASATTLGDSIMYHDSGNSRIGISNTTPACQLHLYTSEGSEVRVESTTNTSYSLFGMGTNNNTRAAYVIAYGSAHVSQANEFSFKNTYGNLTFYPGAAGSVNKRFAIESDGGVFAYTLATDTGTDLIINASNEICKKSSARRFKKNIRKSKVDSSILQKFKVVDFEWKETSRKDIGFIANDLAKLFPGIETYSGTKIQSWDTQKMLVLAVKEIQRLNDRIVKLEGI